MPARVARPPKVALTPQLARFIETLGAMWEGYGMARGAGRIFGYLFSPHAWEHVAAIRSQEARRCAELAEHTLGALPAGHPGRKGLEEFRKWATIFGDAVDRVRMTFGARARRRARGTTRP